MCIIYTEKFVCQHTSPNSREQCQASRSGRTCGSVNKTVHSAQPCWRCTQPINDYMSSRPAGLSPTNSYTSTPDRYTPYQAAPRPARQQQPRHPSFVAFSPQRVVTNDGGFGSRTDNVPIDPRLMQQSQRAFAHQVQPRQLSFARSLAVQNENQLFFNTNNRQQAANFGTMPGSLMPGPPTPRAVQQPYQAGQQQMTDWDMAFGRESSQQWGYFTKQW